MIERISHECSTLCSLWAFFLKQTHQVGGGTEEKEWEEEERNKEEEEERGREGRGGGGQTD